MKRHRMTALGSEHARTLRRDVIDGHAVAADDDGEIDALLGQRVQLFEIGLRKGDDVEIA
jgi:hypothetical protein